MSGSFPLLLVAGQVTLCPTPTWFLRQPAARLHERLGDLHTCRPVDLCATGRCPRWVQAFNVLGGGPAACPTDATAVGSTTPCEDLHAPHGHSSHQAAPGRRCLATILRGSHMVVWRGVAWRGVRRCGGTACRAEHCASSRARRPAWQSRISRIQAVLQHAARNVKPRSAPRSNPSGPVLPPAHAEADPCVEPGSRMP